MAFPKTLMFQYLKNPKAHKSVGCAFVPCMSSVTFFFQLNETGGQFAWSLISFKISS